jgi:hypothetical protein
MSTPPRPEKGSTTTNRDGRPQQIPEFTQIQQFVNYVATRPGDVKKTLRQMQNYLEKLME